MADWQGIRQAIATQMGAASSVVESSADEAQGVGSVPTVRVTHVDMLEIDGDAGGRGAAFEARRATIKGVLLVDQSGAVAPSLAVVDDVVEDLFAAARTGLKLGYGTVVRDSWLETAQVGYVTFGGVEWVGAELTWIVVVREAVTRTA